ncbi:MAG: universal stress protein [Pseudomonadota bacterium]
MICLAYDGSINGDWIAWYAVTLAAHAPERRLQIIHIAAGEFPLDEVRAKIGRIERHGAAAGIAIDVSIQPSSGDRFRDLIERIGQGAHTVVCGARVRGGGRGYLAGTISERLLEQRRFDVVAIRVVQPGLLGTPRRILFPVAGGAEGLQAGAGLLRQFLPIIEHLHLLHVVMVKRIVYRRLDAVRAARLREKGWRHMEGFESELLARVGLTPDKVGADVVVSDDWAHELIIAASRHKSQLILMEASRRHLAGGFFYGDPVEAVLRDAPCDVAVYRGNGRGEGA